VLLLIGGAASSGVLPTVRGRTHPGCVPAAAKHVGSWRGDWQELGSAWVAVQA